MINSGFSATNSARFAADDIAAPTELVTGTALVALERPATRSVSRSVRLDASFVTHLIATAMQMPQTRPLRRLNPSDAGAAYIGKPARAGTAHGRIVTQTA